MRRHSPGLAGLAVLLIASCTKPQPAAPKKAPPLFISQVSPAAPLSLEGRSQAIGPGKAAVEIFANGIRVATGTLTTQHPRDTFRGRYEGHDVVAECVLTEKVRCSISIDGAREAGAQDQPLDD